jgi:hypothetical protein
MGFFNTLRDVMGGMFGQMEFMSLLNLNRSAAMNQISAVVRSSSPAGLRQYEIGYLNYSLNVFDPDQKIRATELYAWLKICEYIKVGEFRGFPDEED